VKHKISEFQLHFADLMCFSGRILNKDPAVQVIVVEERVEVQRLSLEDLFFIHPIQDEVAFFIHLLFELEHDLLAQLRHAIFVNHDSCLLGQLGVDVELSLANHFDSDPSFRHLSKVIKVFSHISSDLGAYILEIPAESTSFSKRGKVYLLLC